LGSGVFTGLDATFTGFFGDAFSGTALFFAALLAAFAGAFTTGFAVALGLALAAAFTGGLGAGLAAIFLAALAVFGSAFADLAALDAAFGDALVAIWLTLRDPSPGSVRFKWGRSTAQQGRTSHAAADSLSEEAYATDSLISKIAHSRTC
jgi:hypothetical protein